MNINNRVVLERPVLLRPNMQEISIKEVVCGYARVSTSNDEQEDSFESQQEHFMRLIKSRTDWEFGGIYADHGISGTSAESRKEFMRMIEDCRTGKINRVLVKSISRFARNTVDTLKYIRELKDLGVSVVFETQNIDTMTPGGEILITILAAIAEQESRNMSTNIKWAYQKRFKEGNVIINYKNTLGYAKEDDTYVVIKNEAETIKLIYREYLGGATDANIAKKLTEMGIKTPRGKDIWSTSTVQSMLQNEKYTGNAILGKTFKSDVTSPRRQKNNGQAPSYYVENSHPAIISTEMFDLAQAERQRRKSLRNTANSGDGKYSSIYALSGLLVCGQCGSKFRRYGRSLANGSKVATWVCITHQKDRQQCKMLPIKESDVYEGYKRVIGRLAGDLDEITRLAKQNIESELCSTEEQDLYKFDKEIIHWQKQILELFKQRKESKISTEEYNKRYKNYSTKVFELQAKQTELKDKSLALQLNRQRLIEITEVFSSNTTNLASDNIMRQLVECINVKSKHELEFQFKCGILAVEKI